MVHVMLAGASLESPNRGGQALCWGAVEWISREYPGEEIQIYFLLFGNEKNEKRSLSEEGYANITLNNIYITKYDLARIFVERRFLSIAGIKYESKLSGIVSKASGFYNVNGGDSFSDIYGWNQFYNYAIPSVIAILCKIKLILLPQTIGPFHLWYVKRLSHWIVKKAFKIYVRDETFCGQLDQWRAEYEKSVDLSYYMKPQSIPELAIEEDSVGINISGLMYYNRYKKMSGQFDAYPALLMKIVADLQKQNLSVYLIPHTYSLEHPIEEDDLSAIQDFYAKIPDKRGVYLLCGNYNAPQLKYIISKMNLFIGSRMHACFAALFCNVPTIGLAYSEKFVGSFRKFGDEKNCIRINNLQAKELQTVFEQIQWIYNPIVNV